MRYHAEISVFEALPANLRCGTCLFITYERSRTTKCTELSNRFAPLRRDETFFLVFPSSVTLTRNSCFHLFFYFSFARARRALARFYSSSISYALSRLFDTTRDPRREKKGTTEKRGKNNTLLGYRAILHFAYKCRGTLTRD